MRQSELADVRLQIITGFYFFARWLRQIKATVDGRRSRLDMFHVSLRDVFLMKARRVGEMTDLPVLLTSVMPRYYFHIRHRLFVQLHVHCRLSVCGPTGKHTRIGEKMAEQHLTFQNPK